MAVEVRLFQSFICSRIRARQTCFYERHLPQTMNAIKLLTEGSVDRWNHWRAENPYTPCILEGKDLSKGYFYEGDFSGVNLRGANLQRACLIGADFRWADLRGADFSGAYLDEANFYGANLNEATFAGATLERANLLRVHWLGQQVADADSYQLPDDLTAATPPVPAKKSPVPKASRRDSGHFMRSLAWHLRPQQRPAKRQAKLHPILGLGVS